MCILPTSSEVNQKRKHHGKIAIAGRIVSMRPRGPGRSR